MVTLVANDLAFILKQIQIAEAHANGGDLATLVGHPLLPYGLRTVDGSYNNIVPGREQWGASGDPFPRLLEPEYRNDGDGDTFYGTVNTDYGATGNVADADPRLISNLIVDQSLDNPAAVRAALLQSGVDFADLAVAEQAVATAHETYQDAIEGVTDPLAIAAARAVRDEALGSIGIEMAGDSVVIRNVAPDEGLSASYNSWFTLFGQFFDHGLDLVKKGGNGTIYIPLEQDDPLYDKGADGVAGTMDDGRTNFMAVTRIAPTTDEGEAANVTTPWVDQNQTYTSHASHQVFLREYKIGADGKPFATGHLLESPQGGPATWGQVKAQAKEMLGIDLTDADVGMVPLVLTDPYGRFIPDPETGFAQVAFPQDNGDGTFSMAYLSGTPAEPLSLAGAARTPNAFLDDIAHNAVPGTTYDDDGNPGTPMVEVGADADTDVGNAILTDARGNKVAYDNELLDAHLVTGDGRGNENIGLTAVHHVFHSEHNRLVEHVKDVVLATGDLAFINEWLKTDVGGVPASSEGLDWDGERLFQAARFTTEMQYQHLVFEEFARKIQPDIDIFMVQPNVELNPAIFAEFAHVVYRFGHSMLNETVDRIGADGQRQDLDLFDAFLNPVQFTTLGGTGVSAAEGAGAIIRGMTGQVGNEIDEFVTGVLRNQLVGLPLDLAAINIARGRDAGIPSLNEARAQFREMAGGDSQLDPYVSWVDFATNLKNPASIVNFIAAYGTHTTITAATTIDGKRDAAMKLVFGGTGAPEDRLDFLNAQGSYAGSKGGLDDVDLWVGGLAEKKMAFGGMLGSTFSFVFELQMENLQNADRFYYLSRTQGMNLLSELENNSLAKMVMRNTDLGESGFALPGDIFSTPDHVLYVQQDKQLDFGHADPVQPDPVLAALSPLVERSEGYIKFNGLEHVVIAGTVDAEGNDNYDDTIISGGGDDAIWGFGGNDRIEAGYGVDKVMGGDGDDIITNAGTDIGETDMLHGDGGNDVIHGGSGLSLIFGGSGKDAIILGPDGSEARSGTESDFVLGREGSDIIFGNEGDDWVEAGANFDYIAGDNGDIFFNSPIIGHDVLNGGSGDTDYDADSGDDIMFGGEGIQKFIGMWGFDWAIYKGQESAVEADMNILVFTSLPAEVLRDRFSEVEALSGWKNGDVLLGDDRAFEVDVANDPTPEGNFIFSELTQDGIARIFGLNLIVTADLLHEIPQVDPDNLDVPGDELDTFMGFAKGNIILGGGGADTIEGRGGDDIIDGDAWLNVRIAVDGRPELEVDSLAQIQGELLAGTINPGQLSIVREILHAPSLGDVAVFSGDRDEYEILANADGSFSVIHDGGDGADGTDRVRNIEILRFADGDSIIGGAADNLPLSDLTPTSGQPLTVALADPDGIISSSVTWEVETAPGVWTMMETGPDFVPSSEEVGLRLRVTASYTDGLGNSTVYAPVITAVVGTNYVGTNGGNNLGLTEGADLANGLGMHDVIAGLGGDDTILGGIGNDSLSGGEGNDSLLGEAGHDWLDGGAGADTMEGGVGNDVYVVDHVDDVVVEAADGGTDVIRTSLTTFTLGANIENLTYIGGETFLGIGNELANVMNGGTGANTLIGLDGDDRLNGMGGNDSLLGGAGTDTLHGGSGDDTLDGGLGADSLVGGMGSDLFRVDDAGDIVVDGGAGIDTVEASINAYTLTGSVEILLFTGTGDFAGNGNALGNTIVGGDGEDVLHGFGGADSLVGGDGGDDLYGGIGNDILRGGAGNDSLFGEAGLDTLDGGEGDDTLSGGVGGQDRFIFGANFGNDVITDFGSIAGSAQDRIDVTAFGITNLAGITVTEMDEGTLLSFGGGTVMLLGVAAATIDSNDFGFA